MMKLPLMSTRQVREGSIEYDGPLQIHGPEEVISALRSLLDGRDRELFGVLALSTKHCIIGLNIVSIGTLNGASAHPREVFRWAITAGAKSIICFHNHPSGDPTPSPEYHAVTRRLRAAGTTIGIDVVDHLVLGADGRFEHVAN